MKKKTKYLDFYKKYADSGVMPEKQLGDMEGGLCCIFGPDKMKLFEPTEYDCNKYKVYLSGYWGYDGDGLEFDGGTYFGPTRQNIVLLLAAINDEL